MIMIYNNNYKIVIIAATCILIMIKVLMMIKITTAIII